MGYKLAIKDQVNVLVEFRVDDGAGATVLHRFTIKGRRIGEKEFKEGITDPVKGEATNERIRALLVDIMTGWEGQKFVLDDETGEPAPFSADAFEYLLDQSGVLDVVANSYRKVITAKAKN